MNDAVEPKQVPEEASSSQAAQRLRQAREARGLHIAVIAATLKVPVDRLQALEEGRFHDLPNLTFARALATSVCRVLKVDAAPILQGFPEAGDLWSGDNQGHLNAPFPDRSGRSVRHKTIAMGPVKWSIPALISVAVIALAACLWWWLPQQERVTMAPAEQVAGAAASSSSSVALPLTPPQASVQADHSESGVLRMLARQSSWVQVTGASGNTLLQRNLAAGESVTFNEDMPLQVVVGRVDETEVSVRGKVMDLAGLARNNVARFEVK